MLSELILKHHGQMHVSNYFKNSMMNDIKNRKRRFGCEYNSKQKIGLPYQFCTIQLHVSINPYQRRPNKLYI